MKMLRAAIVGMGIAVGATPAAFAETSAPVDANAFARGGLIPVAAEAPRYPARSEQALEEGVCTVRFDIRADGAVADAETVSCTSWDFEREAHRVVSGLRYPARSGGAVIEDQEITFRWLGEDAPE